MPPPRGHGAGKRARPLRDDGKRARQAGVFRPCARTGLPRSRHPRARPVSPRRHGGGLRGDPRGDRRREADLRARRLRRRRHLRHGARGHRAARARRRGLLASAEPLRRGLRLVRRNADSAGRRGNRAGPHGRLRDHGGRGGRPRQGAGPRRRRHRPPPAGRDASRLPRGRDASFRLPVPRALRNRCRLQARAGTRRSRTSTAGSTSSRSPRWRTSSRFSTRTEAWSRRA